MTAVDLQEAQSHLVELVEKAANGEPFIIERAGKPLVKVMAIEPTRNAQGKRTGFMAGRIKVPDNFDSLASDDILRLFEHGE